MNIEVNEAPQTPLNLQFGVLYKPRISTPPFVAFEAVEIAPEQWQIRAYDEAGVITPVFRGQLIETYYRLASHLRMDVPV